MQNDSTSDADWPDPRYGWFVTAILLLAFTFSFVDRQVLNLLVEPIQKDLGISDTQISFLQGMAFVITYVGMSVPIGRMVDRFNRVGIMIGGVLVWSATTVACGLSRTYIQLFGARLGVGARGPRVLQGRAFGPAGSWLSGSHCCAAVLCRVATTGVFDGTCIKRVCA